MTVFQARKFFRLLPTQEITVATARSTTISRPMWFSTGRYCAFDSNYALVTANFSNAHRRIRWRPHTGHGWVLERGPTCAARSYSSLVLSDSFWTDLKQAAQLGDGIRAEGIVDRIIQDYCKHQVQQNNRRTTTNKKERLDGRIFSLVLEAWKNSENPSVQSAVRSQKLLTKMTSLAEEGILLEKPSFRDYLTVLECWERVYSNGCSSKLDNAEKIWSLMTQMDVDGKESVGIRFLREEMYLVFLSILAKAGNPSRAEEILEEYKQWISASTSNGTSGDDSSYSRGFHITVSSKLCHLVLQAYSRCPETKISPELAEKFVRRMHSDPFLPNPDADSYNMVLNCWLSSKDRDYTEVADHVENLISEMKHAKVQPNLVSYQYGIDAFARLGEAPRAEALLANLLKDYTNQFDADLKPCRKPFHSVLWAYSKSNLPDAAEQAESILQNMRELSSADFATFPTVWDYNLVLKSWARNKSPFAVDRAITLYDEMLSTPRLEGGRIVAEDEQTDTSLPVHEASLEPDITSMNTVLNVSSANEQAFQTEKLLWKFYDRHLQDPLRNPRPDAISFSIVMHAWSRSRDSDAPLRAEKLLKKLEELYHDGNEDCKPDLLVYSSLIECFSRSKRKEAPWKAESILRRLQGMAQNGDVNMLPDTPCWNSAIAAWTGQGDRAEALFLEMVEAFRNNNGTFVARPNGVSYTNVLNAWAKTRARDASKRAVALLKKIERLYEDGVLNVKPNIIHYSVVMDCLAYARNRTAAIAAESMLRSIASTDDPDMQPNVISYNSVLKAWSFSCHPEAVSKVTSLLTELINLSEKNPAMRPNGNTFGFVLKTLADSNVPDKASRAEAVLALMKRFKCQHSKWTMIELEKCIGATTISEKATGAIRLKSQVEKGKIPVVGEYSSPKLSMKGGTENDTLK